MAGLTAGSTMVNALLELLKARQRVLSFAACSLLEGLGAEASDRADRGVWTLARLSCMLVCSAASSVMYCYNTGSMVQFWLSDHVHMVHTASV